VLRLGDVGRDRSARQLPDDRRCDVREGDQERPVTGRRRLRGRGLDDLYDDLHSKVEDAGYTILFDEKEEDDAEISYKTKDGSTEGQIALRSCDEDKTSVHVTNRPS
jgi:hypothetical protein